MEPRLLERFTREGWGVVESWERRYLAHYGEDVKKKETKGEKRDWWGGDEN